MSLKSFMEKNSNLFPSGFISPDGDFHYADYMEHWEIADLLCRSYKYDTSKQDPERVLEEKGWIHITRSTLMHCLMIMSEKHWTEAQIEVIHPLIENPPIPLEQGAHWLYGRYYPDIDIKSKEMELIY